MVKRGTRDAMLGGSTVIRQAAGRGHPNRLIYCESTGAEGDLTVASVVSKSQAEKVGGLAKSTQPGLTAPAPWNNEELEKHPEPSSLDRKEATE